MQTVSDDEQPCQHKATIRAAGLIVCFDCGAPLNAKARVIASMKTPRTKEASRG